MGVKHHACAMVLVAGLVALAEPQDALSFVRHNRLELRLRALSDVELEVTQGRQALNRLLLKSEIQATRARLGTTPAPPRPPSTLDKDGATPPSTAATYSTSDRAVLEHEMHGIGQEVHSLVGRVIPWEGATTPPWHTNYGTAALVFTLVWVSQNTQRLILVQGASGTHDATPEQAAAHTQVVARVSRTQIAAPTEFVEALANLRRGLMLLQRRLPPSTIPKQPPAHRRPR